MYLPVLANWTPTRTSLHQATQVIGAIRASVASPQPNFVHLGLTVVPEGLTTGTLPTLGELILDFHSLVVLYKPLDQEPVGFSLVQHSQRSLTDAINNALTAMGHPINLERSRLGDEAIFDINPPVAAGYARALALFAAMFERLHSSLPGPKTPVIVWPHGFDLSFLWFATDEASEKAPHIGFGFSPSSEGLDRPYIYSYPFPLPADVTSLPLPPLARWHTGNWTGTVIDYDRLLDMAEPDQVAEKALREIYETVAPRLPGQT